MSRYTRSRLARWRRRAWWALIPAVTGLVLAGVPAEPAGAALFSWPCGGKHPLKPGGGLYMCSFDDEFSGSTLDGTKWWPVTTATGFHVGAECMVFSPNNVSVSGGMLNLTVRKEAAPFTCTTPTGGYLTQYTSGTVNTLGRFSQAFGRFEIRAKFPASKVPGLQSSLFLLSTTNIYGSWPATGEIDIAEAYSQYPDRVIPHVHYAPLDGVDPNATNNYCRITPGQFHTYAVTWTPTVITIAFDGRTCVSDNWNPAPPLVKPAPFDQPFLIALTQALGVNGNAVTDATRLPGTTQIDYVRVWS